MVIVLLLILLFWWGASINSSNTIEWGDFVALIGHKDAYKYMKKVVFVGNTKVTGEVDDAKLPDDLAYLKPKLKSKNFSVLKLQTIQDQQLQDQLETIQEDSQAHASDGQPSFKWDQQDDPYSGMMSTFMLFLLPMLRDSAPCSFSCCRVSAIRSAAASSATTSKAPPNATSAAAIASPSTTWPACRTPRAN